MLADWLRRPVVLIAAHPDDEVIGVGTLLSRFQDLQAIIHVTDGAPRNSDDIRNAGVGTWQEYAALRKQEFQAAMAEAGVSQVRQICLECPDQHASFRMKENAKQLSYLLGQLRPEVVFTHPYEGGHPDHDATAVSVHRAVEMLRRKNSSVPQIVEFASYHMGPNGIETGCFLRYPGAGVDVNRQLNDEERKTKQRLFDCYVSQRAVLGYFSVDREPLRIAPDYDFAKPPHEGKLFFEQFDWGVTGEQWRKLAAQEE